MLRKLWDGRTLRVMSRHTSATASNVHGSIIAHITNDDLLKFLTPVATTNGFANRFSYFATQRTGFLAFPPNLYGNPDYRMVKDDVTKTLQWAMAQGDREMKMTPKAMEMWESRYREVTADRPGIFGALTARNAAHARRFAGIYAMVDRKLDIDVEHMN